MILTARKQTHSELFYSLFRMKMQKLFLIIWCASSHAEIVEQRQQSRELMRFDQKISFNVPISAVSIAFIINKTSCVRFLFVTWKWVEQIYLPRQQLKPSVTLRWKRKSIPIDESNLDLLESTNEKKSFCCFLFLFSFVFLTRLFQSCCWLSDERGVCVCVSGSSSKENLFNQFLIEQNRQTNESWFRKLICIRIHFYRQ